MKELFVKVDKVKKFYSVYIRKRNYEKELFRLNSKDVFKVKDTAFYFSPDLFSDEVYDIIAEIIKLDKDNKLLDEDLKDFIKEHFRNTLIPYLRFQSDMFENFNYIYKVNQKLIAAGQEGISKWVSFSNIKLLYHKENYIYLNRSKEEYISIVYDIKTDVDLLLDLDLVFRKSNRRSLLIPLAYKGYSYLDDKSVMGLKNTMLALDHYYGKAEDEYYSNLFNLLLKIEKTFLLKFEEATDENLKYFNDFFYSFTKLYIKLLENKCEESMVDNYLEIYSALDILDFNIKNVRSYEHILYLYTVINLKNKFCKYKEFKEFKDLESFISLDVDYFFNKFLKEKESYSISELKKDIVNIYEESFN